MKLKQQMTLWVAVLALVGCNRSENTGTSGEEAKKEIKEAATATKNYLAESKDQFLAATEKQLEELDARIKEWAGKSEGLKDDAKVQADKTLAALREQRKALGAKYEELKAASAEKWQEAKAGFAVAMNELEKAYENAKSKFN